MRNVHKKEVVSGYWEQQPEASFGERVLWLEMSDNFFEGFQMQFKRCSAFRGNKEPGIRFFSDEGFFDAEVACEFQCTGMAGQVPVSEIEEFFEGVKIHEIIDHEGGHDPEAGTAFEGFVQVLQVIFHALPGFRSYFQYRMPPYARWRNPNPMVQIASP
ncbi:MAG: hypothetical protein RL386_1149 [Bacteroidota bacterium]